MVWLLGTVLAFLILLLLYLILPGEWRQQLFQSLAALPRRIVLGARKLPQRLSQLAESFQNRARPPSSREWQENVVDVEEQLPPWQERVRGRLGNLLRAPPAERRTDTAPAPRSSERRSSQEIRLPLIIAILVLLGGALLVATLLERRSPARRAHHLTIAISDLAVDEGTASSREGVQASEELQSFLQQALQEAGLADLVGVRIVHKTPANADAAHELASRHRADLLLWGTLRGQEPPFYALQLALAPRIDKEVPEFDEYFQWMLTPTNVSMIRKGSETVLSQEDVAAALTWLARFYLGQFDQIEGASPDMTGHPALAPELFILHRASILWLRGDYNQATTTLDGLLGAEYAVSIGEGAPTGCSGRTDPLLCVAASNNKAVVLLTKEALGAAPPASIDQAISLLEGAAQQAPQSIVVRHNLGRAYLVRRAWNQAILTLLEAYDQNPKYVPVLVAMSEAYRRSGNLRAAKEAANRAVAIDRESPAARLALGRCLLNEGNSRQARRTMDQALKLAEAEGKRRRSHEAALREGPNPKTERAIYTGAWAQRSNPILAQIHLAKAELFLVLGKKEGKPSFFVFLWRTVTGDPSPMELAMQEADHALALHPNWYEALYVRGEIHLAGDALDLAIDSYEAAKAQDPADRRAYLALAQALRGQWQNLRREGNQEGAQQKLEQAKSQYRQLVEYNIAPARGYYGLGELTRESGDWSGAYQAYLLAVEANPAYGDAYLRLGQVERKIGEEGTALRFLDLCLQNTGETSATRTWAHTEKGEIFLEQYLRDRGPAVRETLARARNQFTAALAIYANNQRALNGLGRVAYEEGNGEEAERLFRDTLRLNRNSFGALYGLGRVYESRGDSRAALDNFRRAVDVNGGSIAARYHLGVAYYSQLQEEAARQSFQRVVDMCAQQPADKRLLADDTEGCWLAAQRLAQLSNSP